MVSGLLLFASTTLCSLCAAGWRFKCMCSPFSFAWRFFSALLLTRLMNSSREREWRTCSMRTLMRFSMYRLRTCL